MNLLQQLPPINTLSTHLSYGQGKKTAFAWMHGHGQEDITALQNINDPSLAMFIPSDWLLIREQLEQDWEINLPKGKGQETLYSTTFFWNASQPEIEQILELAHKRGWAVYTEVEEKLMLLVINSKVGVDVDVKDVLGQLV